MNNFEERLSESMLSLSVQLSHPAHLYNNKSQHIQVLLFGAAKNTIFNIVYGWLSLNISHLM